MTTFTVAITGVSPDPEVYIDVASARSYQSSPCQACPRITQKKNRLNAISVASITRPRSISQPNAVR